MTSEKGLLVGKSLLVERRLWLDFDVIDLSPHFLESKLSFQKLSKHKLHILLEIMTFHFFKLRKETLRSLVDCELPNLGLLDVEKFIPQNLKVFRVELDALADSLQVFAYSCAFLQII